MQPNKRKVSNIYKPLKKCVQVPKLLEVGIRLNEKDMSNIYKPLKKWV